MLSLFPENVCNAWLAITLTQVGGSHRQELWLWLLLLPAAGQNFWQGSANEQLLAVHKRSRGTTDDINRESLRESPAPLHAAIHPLLYSCNSPIERPHFPSSPSRIRRCRSIRPRKLHHQPGTPSQPKSQRAGYDTAHSARRTRPTPPTLID